MIGKKNIVFGFLYLATTAALGPYMVNMYQDFGVAAGEKQQAVGYLQELKAGNYAENPQTLEDLTPKDLGAANADAILALSKQGNIEFGIDLIKGGPHAHGNLEALLNITVGVVLCFLAAPILLKQIISWVFILGALLHSGLLYLERVFAVVLPTPLMGAGPLLILFGLLFTGLVAMRYLRAEIIRD
jgi:hypothetical protein